MDFEAPLYMDKYPDQAGVLTSTVHFNSNVGVWLRADVVDASGATVLSKFSVQYGVGKPYPCAAPCRSQRLLKQSGSVTVSVESSAKLAEGATATLQVQLYGTGSLVTFPALDAANSSFVVRRMTTPTTTATSTATATATTTPATTASMTATATMESTATSTEESTATMTLMTTATTTGTFTVTTTMRCQSDYSQWWKDSAGYTCNDYREKRWCTTDGEYGPKWGKVTQRHSFAAYASMHSSSATPISATRACCLCGGGFRVQPHHPDNTKPPTTTTQRVATTADPKTTVAAGTAGPGQTVETNPRTTAAATTQPKVVLECCAPNYKDQSRCPMQSTDPVCSSPFARNICKVACGVCKNCGCCEEPDHPNCPRSKADPACQTSGVAKFCGGVCGSCKVCTTTSKKPTTTTKTTITTTKTTTRTTATTSSTSPKKTTTVTTTTTVSTTTVATTTIIHDSCTESVPGVKKGMPCNPTGIEGIDFCGRGVCQAGACLKPACSLNRGSFCVGKTSGTVCLGSNRCIKSYCYHDQCLDGVNGFNNFPAGTTCRADGVKGTCSRQGACMPFTTTSTTTVAASTKSTVAPAATTKAAPTPPPTKAPTKATAPPATPPPPPSGPVQSCFGAPPMSFCYSGCNLGICAPTAGFQSCVPLLQSRCASAASARSDPLCLPGGLCNTQAPATAPTPPAAAAFSPKPVATTKRACDPNREYTCNNMDCIRIDYYCNKVFDCADGSDEAYCPAPTAQATAQAASASNSSDSAALTAMGVIIALMVVVLLAFFGYRVYARRKSDGN